MTHSIRDLGNPSEFWEYFEQISKIPHCSGNEKLIREFIIHEANNFGFETKVDKVGNLVMKIPSKIGVDKPKIIIQCHLDMVCEKNEEIVHDFSKDPLKLKVIEVEANDWLTAEGTTLGADNGVGIAYLLTLMKKIHFEELKFGPLEFLFTVDEEKGLVGVFQMDRDFVEGDYLINLDTAEDDRFIIGCCGGLNSYATINIEKFLLNQNRENFEPLRIFVSGLIGGHSGGDIHRGRANAIEILTHFLWKLNNKYKFHLVSINGGGKFNAIPREASAIIFVEKEVKEKLYTFMNDVLFDRQKEFSNIDPNINISIKNLDKISDNRVFSKVFQDKILQLLLLMPHGPISMHPEIRNLVFTSTNFATIKTHKNNIKILSHHRSFESSALKFISDKFSALFNLSNLNVKTSHAGGYGGWSPDFNSKILKVAKDTYKDLFNEKAKVLAVHAGLECGILKERYPEIDMISLGPKVIDAHSPDEKLKVISVEKIWNLILKLLNNISLEHQD